MAKGIPLLANQTANVAAGAGITAKFLIKSGHAQFVAYGTWGGATVTLYFLADDGTTWIAYDNGALTANGSFEFYESQNTYVCAVVTGASGTTNLNAYFDGFAS